TGRRPPGAQAAAAPVEEKLLIRRLAGAEEAKQLGDKFTVALSIARLEPQPPQQLARQLRPKDRPHFVERWFQSVDAGQRQKALGQPRQIPRQRVGLTAEAIQPRFIE